MARISLPQKKANPRSSGGNGQWSEADRQQIEKLAYQFYADRGYEHGHDAEDWGRAEAIVRARRR
ncbi:MAG: hypothetical protein A3D28_03440 [Omnitrophica bacterium RIFCSPHIGHO2_02_FULL_63_14]|nr:MAG: hypothetical protein A3D28_03440 [Omnitrophica bacterium RIFCSPHIGHO2_02_FULL_63_14]